MEGMRMMKKVFGNQNDYALGIKDYLGVAL